MYGCAANDKTITNTTMTSSQKKEILTNQEEETTLKSDTTKDTGNVGTTKNEDATKELVSSKEDATTTENDTTTEKKNEQSTTKKPSQTQPTTKKPSPTQSTTPSDKQDEYVYEDGSYWYYRSEIYDDNTLKGRMEDIFWDEYGWTELGKNKNDQMVVAMVELVYEIMTKYSTDFEREKALYEAICLSCSYDYECKEAGTTLESQTPYGLLIKHKALTSGYAYTFAYGLSMMGIENELVRGYDLVGNRVWNLVCIEGDWYEVDIELSDGADDNYNYWYFNLTTEEMTSLYHTRTSNNLVQCYGTKYNEAYITNLYMNEFLANNEVVNTVEDALRVMNEQISNGATKVVALFEEPELRDELFTIFMPKWEDEADLYKIFTVDKNSEYYYFEYSVQISYYAEGTEYKHATMTGIHDFVIYVEYLNDYRSMENYFETYEDFYEYVRKQKEKGATEVIGYLAFPEQHFFDYPLDNRKMCEGIKHESFVAICDSANLVEYTVYFE